MGLVACPATRKQQVRICIFSSIMLNDTNLTICTGRDFNKALLSGLIAEERTRQLLEIVPAERDYRVALSKANLKSCQLWAFFEERQGIPFLPIDLVLPILRLRHAIHITFRGSDLQPLTVDELCLGQISYFLF